MPGLLQAMVPGPFTLVPVPALLGPAVAADAGKVALTTSVRTNARTKVNTTNLTGAYFIVSPPLAICIPRFGLCNLLHGSHPFWTETAEGCPLALFVDETKSQMLASGQSYALSIL